MEPVIAVRPPLWRRLAVLAGLFTAYLVSLGVAQAVAGALGTGDPATSPLVAATNLGALGLLVAAGTKVSYRWVDALLLLVPVVSVYYACKVVWRVTALPWRYWPERPTAVAAHVPANCR